MDTLRCYIKDESVDLIYLDPPLNSNATYNVLFKEYNDAEAIGRYIYNHPANSLMNA